MNFEQIERLVLRLQTGPITACDFDAGDGSRLQLRFGGTQLQPTAVSPAVTATQVASVGLPGKTPADQVIAPRFGFYLHAHPSSGHPAIEPGQRVKEGDIVGFIQAGDILVPVEADQDGILHERPVEHGALVGYGTVLARLGRPG